MFKTFVILASSASGLYTHSASICTKVKFVLELLELLEIDFGLSFLGFSLLFFSRTNSLCTMQCCRFQQMTHDFVNLLST